MKKLFFLLLLIIVSASVYGQETSYICTGSTKTLTASASGGASPYTYKWVKPNGDTITNVSVTAAAAGIYTWLAKDANGCQATGTHTVNIVADPTASITINASDICLNTAQTISATGVPAGYTYSWSFGSGSSPSTSTSASTSVSYSTTGTKTITLTISKDFAGSANGCSATCSFTKTKTITVSGITGGSSCS